MIESLQIKNFLSFKDEVTLSFEATKDDHLEDYHVVEVAPGVRLLKFVVVYGYNASGKSNLIEAVAFLKYFWFKIKENKTEKIDVVNFLLDKDSRNNPTQFKLTFYIGKVKHRYQLTIDRFKVRNEQLDYYPGPQPAKIFSRVTENGVSEISFGSKMKLSSVAKESISIRCLPNMSVFAAYSQVNTNIKQLDDVFGWIEENFFTPIEPQTRLKDFVENLVYKDKKCKDKILNYLKRADFNISDINVEEVEDQVSEDFISRMKALDVPQHEINRLENERSIRIKQTDFNHFVFQEDKMETYPLTMDLQSEGTRRIFGLSGAIYEAIKKDAFLAIDEIESKLHPHLIEFLIEEFLKESKQNPSQLLVATHYDNLFDQEDLLRKDNFWFTEKGEDAATKLYPLSALKGLNRISSLQKAYKFGKFGAIPDIE